MTDRSPTPMYDFLREVQEEFNGFMLGEYLGGGESRAVYEAPFLPKEYVVKVERPSDKGDFCNVVEHLVWNHLCDSPYADWLAPCGTISRHGTFLVQKRCQVISEDRIPRKAPWFFQDAHKGNWGLYEDRPVLFDYGFLYGFLRKAKYDKQARLVSLKSLDKKTEQ